MKDDTELKISLRDYFDLRVDNIEKATALAASTLNQRLEGMNEFRNQLKDQAANFTTRDELNSVISRLEVDIRNLQLAKAQLEGKASQESVSVVSTRAQWGIIFGAVASVLAVISFLSNVFIK